MNNINNMTNKNNYIELELGDIINIQNSNKSPLNEKTLYIDYIDNNSINLIDIDTNDKFTININEDGSIDNITKVIVISRSDQKGYALQNNYLPDTWINIHFGGEFPAILTALITNLENDMIEIKTMDDELLYINFDYKGIPKDLPIELIEVREKPRLEKETTIIQPDDAEIIIDREEVGDEDKEEIEQSDEMQPDEFVKDTSEIEKIDKEENDTHEIPVIRMKDRLKEFVIKADQIQFGDEDLGVITQFKEVSSKYKRYSLEDQLTDMLDEFLSTIPDSERTSRVLNNIHLMINRFKQLRQKYSVFDNNDLIVNPIVYEASYIPIMDYFKNFNINLYWILPVVKNIKKLYIQTEDDEIDPDAAVDINQFEDLEEIESILQSYKSDSYPTDINRYRQLYEELDPYFTPFNYVHQDQSQGMIINKLVHSNLNCIIDNLENMYSTVFGNNQTKTTRFLLQKYNTSLTKLDTIDNTSSRTITRRINISPPDHMSLKSFIILPEPIIRYSRINLPNTNLIDRANLNLISMNYWQLLTSKTSLLSEYIDKFDKPSSIASIYQPTNYILNVSENELKEMTKDEVYEKYITSMIPRSKNIFQMMEKYIKGKLSFVDIVEYLQPFLIYPDNITYTMYTEITKFLDNQINEYNKMFISKTKNFNHMKNPTYLNIVFGLAYPIISNIPTKYDVRDELFSAYSINTYSIESTRLYSNSELFSKIMSTDSFRLYSYSIALLNTSLMFPQEFSDIFANEQEDVNKQIKSGKEKMTCDNFKIAKIYNNTDDLDNDNNKEIYFDKKYDDTDYSLLSNYEKEINNMTHEDFVDYISNDLSKKQKIDIANASYIANSLVDGFKKVRNNDLALIKDSLSPDIQKYYIRKNNKWEPYDNNETEETLTNDSSILCNLQEKCVENNVSNNECESLNVNRLSIQNKLLENIINEFDKKYESTMQTMIKQIKSLYEYQYKIINKLDEIKKHNKLKYDLEKINISDKDELVEKVQSPNLDLLTLILRQNDFVKKQYDIIRFVNVFTRPPLQDIIGVSGKKEDLYWLYCIKSDLPILPVFKFNIATAFVNDPSNFNNYLDILISQVGKLSDDGNNWIDENSGWTIRKIDESYEEGYEDGFKITSREILEDDAGNKILASSQNVIEYSPKSKAILNIVNAMSMAIGINLETQKEFIINSVNESLNNTVESESDYTKKVKLMAEKNKKLPTYKDFFNTALMYYTLGMILIGIQISIPIIKTRKTHPGCVRSFSGFPFEGSGDYTAVEYIGCVAYDIRTSSEPWYVLKSKKQDFIINKLKTVINSVLIELQSVKMKFVEKTDYILSGQEDSIPEEYSISNWTTFLPPLSPLKLPSISNISPDFNSSLVSELKSGSSKQNEKILVIQSKIYFFSLALQECVQKIVEKETLLLNKGHNEPYLENSCCYTNDKESTINYFIRKDNDIFKFNSIVEYLSNKLYDINLITNAKLLYSIINTKLKYPAISTKFSESTIYLTFIHYCKFKSSQPIPPSLIPLCISKPNISLFSYNLSDEDLIAKIKNDGKDFNYESFLRLLQLVGRHNMMNLNLNNNIISPFMKLSSFLNAIEEENDDTLDKDLIIHIKNVLDTYDIGTSTLTPESKALNNYLIKQNEYLTEKISEYLNHHKGRNFSANKFNKCKNVIEGIQNENTDEVNNFFNSVQFFKEVIYKIISVFPNIILNQVEYKSINIPNYMGLSNYHVKKIQSLVNSYYEDLYVFYGANELLNILNSIQRYGSNLIKLSELFTAFSSIKYDNVTIYPIFNERTSILMYNHLLLKSLDYYIILSTNSKMIVKDVHQDNVVNELVTVDYVGEKETKEGYIESGNDYEENIISGNLNSLQQNVARLICIYTNYIEDGLDIINLSYDNIKDKVHKTKEREKDLITDRLQTLTDEERNADTILKINKLGVWSKGLQKGLTQYVKETYDDERELRNEMQKLENQLRKKDKNVGDHNLTEELDNYIDSLDDMNQIEHDEYDMTHMTDDYNDGNYYGDENDIFQEYDA